MHTKVMQLDSVKEIEKYKLNSLWAHCNSSINLLRI